MRNTLRSYWVSETLVAAVTLGCAWYTHKWWYGWALLWCCTAVTVCIMFNALVRRASLGMSPTMGGTASEHRFRLESMPVNHYGEALRWTLSLLNISFKEEDNAGLIGFFFFGFSVPRLHDLKTASTIGDSKAALQYLRGVLEPQLRRDSFHSHLLRRDNTTKDWEVRLAAYGHDIQRYAYRFLLDDTTPSLVPLALWGAYESNHVVPWVQRTAVKALFPVLKTGMWKAFSLANAERVQGSWDAMTKVWDEADAALARNKDATGVAYLSGSQLSFVDIMFAALTAALLPTRVCLGTHVGEDGACPPRSQCWAGGRFRTAAPETYQQVARQYPPRLLELEEQLMKRPCAQHVVRLYQTYRCAGTWR